MSAAVDVLAIGAHPDDAEIGCAGVLIMSADADLRVAVADLTEGELATHGGPAARREESRRAAELVGLSERIGLGLPDGRLGTEPGHRDVVAELIRERRPRVVLAPYWEDRHPDHAAAGEIARTACFLAGLPKAGRGEPHRPRRLYHYMLHQPFDPSLVVDVSAVWRRKLASLEAYESQFGDDATLTEVGSGRFLDFLEQRARFHGAMIGAEHGEPFRCRGPVAVTTLPGVEGDGPKGQDAYRSII